MGLNDAINRLERQLTDDAAAWNDQNADRLREEKAQRDAERDFEHAVSTRIIPAFKQVTDRLRNLGLSVERPYERDIQLVVNDQRHGKYSLRYQMADGGEVIAIRLVMDGNGDIVAKVPLSELTQQQVEAQVADFIDWYLGMVG